MYKTKLIGINEDIFELINVLREMQVFHVIESSQRGRDSRDLWPGHLYRWNCQIYRIGLKIQEIKPKRIDYVYYNKKSNIWLFGNNIYKKKELINGKKVVLFVIGSLTLFINSWFYITKTAYFRQITNENSVQKMNVK